MTSLGRFHLVTAEMCDVPADCLAASGHPSRTFTARRAVAAVHTAILVLLLGRAMANALNFHWRHGVDAFVKALIGIPVPDAAWGLPLVLPE